MSRFLKYKLCPPPFVSRVLLSWQLVDPYLYESINVKYHIGFSSNWVSELPRAHSVERMFSLYFNYLYFSYFPFLVLRAAYGF